MISLRSKITQKVLSYLFLHPEANLYLNEMSRLLELDRGNLVKKLRELKKEGLLLSEVRGNQKYYSLNTQYPFFEEYKKIFLKTVGIEKELKEALKKLGKVKEAYIFGSYASGKMEAQSDIDVLVVSTGRYLDLMRALQSIQEKTKREINVVDLSPEEFKRKMNNKDPLLVDIFKNKKIKLV